MFACDLTATAPLQVIQEQLELQSRIASQEGAASDSERSFGIAFPIGQLSLSLVLKALRHLQVGSAFMGVESEQGPCLHMALMSL